MKRKPSLLKFYAFRAFQSIKNFPLRFPQWIEAGRNKHNKQKAIYIVYYFTKGFLSGKIP
jgi:hypothetical protein